jgi:hypothetical protein
MAGERNVTLDDVADALDGIITYCTAVRDTVLALKTGEPEYAEGSVNRGLKSGQCPPIPTE